MNNDEELLEEVIGMVRKGDVIVTVGAGSITNFGPKILHSNSMNLI